MIVSGWEMDLVKNRRESEFLDRKQKYHSNKASFIHDVLCLTNAYSEYERYLIFGVTDGGEILGVENDTNRRKNADIQDLFRQINLNRVPSMELIRIPMPDGHEVDILTIANRPDKPFYLQRDYTDGDKRVRGGVIYTRLGDTNTPLNETAPEDRIELMWRERFGIGLAPLERLKRLLRNPSGWEGPETAKHNYAYPEFTIVQPEDEFEPWEEDWVKTFPDPSARKCIVEARYHSTVLRRLTMVVCDGGRFTFPLPEVGPPLTVRRDSLSYLIACLYPQYLDLDTSLVGAGIKVVGN